MNDGFVNETELIEYINNNLFKDYNSNIKKFMEFVFGTNIGPNDSIYAEKCVGQVKPDIKIIYQNNEKYVSIKKGSGNSVHQENISMFFPFVEELCGPKVLKHLKTFHYGDDTDNDSGIFRHSASECQHLYSYSIAIVNSAFNSPENLKKFLDRFLFIGNVGLTANVDVIYHGTIINGVWASRLEIYNYFLSKEFTTSSVHFASLTYQVWGRNNEFTAVHPERRYVMQVKWGSIINDLSNIRRIVDEQRDV